MEVVVECVKGSKDKYEKVETANGIDFRLERRIKRKWASNYGYIPFTLQGDGDELDTYVIGRNLKTGRFYEAIPLCMIYSIDNGQIDNKMICLTANARRVKRTIKKILRFVGQYKKGSYVAGITWGANNLQFEISKCKAMYKLFKKGGNV